MAFRTSVRRLSWMLLLAIHLQVSGAFITWHDNTHGEVCIRMTSHSTRRAKYQQIRRPNDSGMRFRTDSPSTTKTMPLHAKLEDDDWESTNNQLPLWLSPIVENPKRSVIFSLLMASCGAMLGPFLDSYHSAFGVLQYDQPIRAILWGNEQYPALTTTWWVPELFGLAGFLIGWLYIVLDKVLDTSQNKNETLDPSPFKICLGISIFTLQYWLSGILVQSGVDRTTILNLMSVIAASGFFIFDGTMAGLLTSAATAMGGPLIEAGLIWSTAHGLLTGGYHYTDLGETGFFPLWIVPVYFLGGPANGNLARGFWNILSERKSEKAWGAKPPCEVCNDTRRDICPNCDGVGTYTAMGGQNVKCTSCSGRGYVMCRACFDLYDEDAYDIEAIRDVMRRMPD